jgi:hypothetical protein
VAWQRDQPARKMTPRADTELDFQLLDAGTRWMVPLAWARPSLQHVAAGPGPELAPLL